MTSTSLQYDIRDIVGRTSDQRSGFSERFAANRELTITAIPGRNDVACGVAFTLIGSPVRGLVVIHDISYGNPGAVDVLAGAALETDEVELLMAFLVETSGCLPGNLPADYRWSSIADMAIAE